MPPPPRIHILVLNWNGRDDTLACLRSLTKIDYPNYETVVIDNGSTDGSAAAIKAAFPDVTLLETGRNLGYAGGNNVGITHALEHGARFVFILNNDTEVSPDILDAFLEAQRAYPEAGVYGAKIFEHDKPDTLCFAGGQWLPEKLRFTHIGAHQTDCERYSHYRECDYVTGCALFVDRQVFERVGTLDERYFLTYEETDWCYRARRAGFKCLFVPQATLKHKISVSFGGASSPLVTYFLTRNRLLWSDAHLPRAERQRLRKTVWKELRRALLPRFFIIRSPDSLIKRLHWGLKTWRGTLAVNLREPQNKALFCGVRDYYLRRFGDAPPAVRSLRQL